MTASGTVGVVVIGRNEGERLRRCLASLTEDSIPVVYVDSGSIDGSAELARSMGFDVVELDPCRPFTAARARNAGLEQLLRLRPDLVFVQFVDGDCELVDGWLEQAVRELETKHDVAVVCGRLRERFPEASIYNRLCDLEWDRPTGEVAACGGIALMRVAALREVGGFNPAIIAGEEPELCFRLRQAGWRILRNDAEMAVHDAAILRISQWWKRAVRAGHGYAEGAYLHGRDPGRHDVRPLLSIVLWALAVPTTGLLAAWPTWGASLAVPVLLYVGLWYRIWRRERQHGRTSAEASLQAIFIILAKFAQLQGVMLFAARKLSGRKPELIEHKGADRSSCTFTAR